MFRILFAVLLCVPWFAQAAGVDVFLEYGRSQVAPRHVEKLDARLKDWTAPAAPYIHSRVDSNGLTHPMGIGFRIGSDRLKFVFGYREQNASATAYLSAYVPQIGYHSSELAIPFYVNVRGPYVGLYGAISVTDSTALYGQVTAQFAQVRIFTTRDGWTDKTGWQYSIGAEKSYVVPNLKLGIEQTGAPIGIPWLALGFAAECATHQKDVCGWSASVIIKAETK